QHHLNTLFEMAVEGYENKDEGIAIQLHTLVEAARDRKVKPSKGLDRIGIFLNSTNEEIVLNAIQLIGYWEQVNAQLIKLIRDGDRRIVEAALNALAVSDKVEAEKLLVSMTDKTYDLQVRLLATIQLVPLNVREAGRTGVQLLQDLTAEKDITSLFNELLALEQGPEVLARELSARKVSVRVAKAGRIAVEGAVPPNRQGEDDVKQLKKVLESLGGKLPPQRMPQQM